jgi:DinB superfamily
MLSMHTLTADQRTALSEELERTQAALLNAARGLTSAQFTWKPSPDRWSVAETLEHIALVEGLFQGRLNRMSAAEASGEAAERVAGRSESVARAGRNRGTKRNAPTPAQPKGVFTTFEAFQIHFTPLRQRSIAFVQTTAAPLHAVTEVHPALGELSGHQWLCLLAAHCERHTEQAHEVRATPGFPQSDVAT